LTPRFENKPPNLERKPLNLSKNKPKNSNRTDNNMLYSNNSPLNTPPTFRNTHSAGRNDPYGINPLPNIRSPYPLYQPYPNLESWGIVNKPFVYEDPFALYRNAQSPFLPVYNSLKKNQKVRFFFLAHALESCFILMILTICQKALFSRFKFTEHIAIGYLR
jgi:hypothetical protein